MAGVLAIGLGAVFVAPAGAGSDKGTLRVATSLPAPGFWNGDTPSSLDGGFEYELAQQIGEDLGYSDVKISNVSFDALVAGKAKGFDFALSQVSITPERAEVVLFSTPYYRSDNGIMVNTGTQVPDAAAARELRWGVQTGTTQVAFLKNKLKVDEAPRVYQETTQMFQALKANQVDAVMTDTSILLAQAGQADSGFSVVGQFKTNTGRYGAVMPKGSKIKADLNAEIKKLADDGTLAALEEQWLVPEFKGNPRSVPYITI
jgi:polar amino acid transport system substrate-binding protein